MRAGSVAASGCSGTSCESLAFPIPEWCSFRQDESKETIDYARGLGWPVRAEAKWLKGGQGVAIGIRSDDEFRSAWQYGISAMTGRRDRDVIVEREHDGIDLRVYVVAGQAVAGTVRLPPTFAATAARP